MLSAICFNLDQSKILSSVNELRVDSNCLRFTDRLNIHVSKDVHILVMFRWIFTELLPFDEI